MFQRVTNDSLVGFIPPKCVCAQILNNCFFLKCNMFEQFMAVFDLSAANDLMT